MRSRLVLLLLALLLAAVVPVAEALALPPSSLALSSPVLGIGAVLFRPKVKLARTTESEDVDDTLRGAGEFFVDAFWTGKLGGAEKLSPNQAKTLERQQIAEFKKRYRPASGSKKSGGGARLPGSYAMKSASSMDARSELVLFLDGRGECVGCAGIEVDTIKKMDGYDTTFKAPLMSNLAVSRKYRRKGLAEDLVKAAESIALKEWGYDDAYLYVEKRNLPAVKLYKKLGYSTVWEDDTATTLLPTEDGRVANGKTTIVCMRKRLGGGLFGSLFAR